MFGASCIVFIVKLDAVHDFMTTIYYIRIYLSVYIYMRIYIHTIGVVQSLKRASFAKRRIRRIPLRHIKLDRGLKFRRFGVWGLSMLSVPGFGFFGPPHCRVAKRVTLGLSYDSREIGERPTCEITVEADLNENSPQCNLLPQSGAFSPYKLNKTKNQISPSQP